MKSFFSVPVAIKVPPVDDPFIPEARETRCVVAWVQVVMSRAGNEQITREMLFHSLGIVALGIIVAARKRGDRVRVQVWDTGIGIGATDLPHIFEEYFQVGNAARDRRQGLGLGLNIVQRLCRLLGHAIEARSCQGRGSVFRLTLPRADEPGLERRHSPGRDWGHFDRQWVVVIEDDADARDALMGLLSGWDLDVVAAENADMALADMPAGLTPDVVISDFRLAHGENGIASIARLRRTWEETLPALLISAIPRRKAWPPWPPRYDCRH